MGLSSIVHRNRLNKVRNKKIRIGKIHGLISTSRGGARRSVSGEIE